MTSKFQSPRPRKPAAARPAAPPRAATFSWVHPIVVSARCQWKCGYCPFPLVEAAPPPSRAKIQRTAAKARELGVRQTRIIAGEGIENHNQIIQTIRYYGWNGLIEYLRDLVGEVARNKVAPPLFPELDIGALSLAQMQRLRPSIFTMRLYLDSMDPGVQFGLAHGESRGKWPRERLTALVNAAKLGVPVNSGIMAGLGEPAESRRAALEALATLAARHRHIQSIAIHPFEPMPGTPMAGAPPPSDAVLLETIADARRILPSRVAVVFPAARRPALAAAAVRAGASDLGDFDLAGEPLADARTLEAFRTIRADLAREGIALRDRLSLFPEYATARWIGPDYMELLKECAPARPMEEAAGKDTEAPSAPGRTAQTRIPAESERPPGRV